MEIPEWALDLVSRLDARLDAQACAMQALEARVNARVEMQEGRLTASGPMAQGVTESLRAELKSVKTFPRRIEQLERAVHDLQEGCAKVQTLSQAPANASILPGPVPVGLEHVEVGAEYARTDPARREIPGTTAVAEQNTASADETVAAACM